MNRFLIILFLLVISSPTYAKIDCNKHKIYCQIMNNNQSLDRKYAMKISNLIYTASRRFKVDSRLLTAIIAQESMYNNNAKGCTTGLNHLYEEKKVCNDFGLTQINYRTARRYQIDIPKLMVDIEYSIESGAKILRDFKRGYGKDPDYWTRYNCGTRGSTARDNCQNYRRLVMRYF